MEPTYGIFLALSFVGGVLAVIALVLISAAMILSRGRPSNEKSTATPKIIEVPPSSLPLSVTPAPVDSVVSPAPATSAATAGDMIEPFLSVVKHYAHSPRTGSAPVDDFIRQMEPRVELATKKAVTRKEIGPQAPFRGAVRYARSKTPLPSWIERTLVDCRAEYRAIGAATAAAQPTAAGGT
jgi:hypothetical protein